MPMLPPSLDDRRFDDLVEELVARIPAHTPEWTNPRLGDPGRTLIELFAWLGDALLYRANLIPERQRLVFLKLLGMGLQPARPARGIVGLAFAQETELGAHTLAPRAKLKAALPFETLAETTVLPVTGECYIKRRIAPADAAKRSDMLQGLARIHRISGALKAYETTPVFPQGRATPAGVDVFAQSADRALWVALLAPKAAQAPQQPTVNEAARLALGGGNAALPPLLSVGLVPAVKPPTVFEDVTTPVAVPVLWEITTQGRSGFETDYLTLPVQAGTDSSGGLARAGTLRLQLPDESLIWAPPNDVGVNPHAGVGDVPPRLDDPERVARVIAWLRLRPLPGQAVEHLPLAWLGVNAVEIEQRATLEGRVLGSSSGAADQAFALPFGSVDAASLQVEVEAPGRGYEPWTRVDDLAAVSADANVARDATAYELDAEAGTLRLGDGVRGKVPEPGMRVRLALGRFGGGRAGNLAPDSLSELNGIRIDGQPAPAIKVLQPLPLAGGEDAETLALAERRIPARLRHRDRAVTEEDYRRLAFEAPAIDVGRVEVLARFKPRDRRFEVPGVVSVLALPAAPLAPAPNPRPDRPFIERLHGFLAARTPLATELYVIGCDYVAVGVSVAIAIRDGFARDQVLLDATAALRRLLWPLAPGGLDAQGWPLGRALRTRELEVEVSRVPGVDELRGLRLFQQREGDWQALPEIAADGAQVLVLQRWQLPELLSIVAIEGASAPTNLRAVPNPFAEPSAVAVPVVPELC
ncbi:putative baseplate assembly protein [Ramlibacter alkalitolerans]|uniref:Baseplate assembly protein n=1 Tax=Ramlibacter alkalitolerans TaxID=2039631 RepID=A0ABS1JIE8_9BURK|nr:putative baseplate assembly protein [Ramlibacter alkalitolerans]MBL0424000.1 putative baseplate assembly protein [Ramlibacter alkalitolerans]